MRLGESCTACHHQVSKAVTHSHASSKHGVLVALEGQGFDLSLPLADANMRAPTCPYCHMHRGEHDVSRSIPAWTPLAGPVKADQERLDGLRQVPCLDCHSPRFVTTWFASGNGMVAVARMKVREAEAIVENAKRDFKESVGELSDHYERMGGTHLKNIWIGVHHQSPDYQWWYGQPALDGDLLRIKGAYGDLLRQRSP